MYWFSNITYELLQKQAISYLFSYNHNFFGRNIQEREQKSPVKVACTVQRPRKNRQIMKALFDGVYQKITVVLRATNQMEANYPVERMRTQRRYNHTA